jgi:predicted dehydrogenase
MKDNGEKKVRYALVGAGNIAQVAVLPAFAHARENSELVAIVSDDGEKRAELAKRYGVELTGTYDELERVIERGRVDAVYVATPNHDHRSTTERAARAGAHVLCEKPMAVTVEDCEAMLAATRAAGVKLMVAYRLHFEEANLRAVDLVQSGKLGQVKLFSSTFTQLVRPGDIRTGGEQVGGGALYDMGVYPINAARYLFRDEPFEAFATCVRGGRVDGADETTVAVLRFPGDRVAHFSVSLGVASVSSYRVAGTEGDLRLEPAYDYVGELEHHLTVGGKTEERTFKKRDQFAPELVHFSRCILEGREPEPSGEEGLADVRIVRALLRSAETGQWVKLEPFVRSQRPSLANEMRKPPVKEPKTVHAPSPSEK